MPLGSILSTAKKKKMDVVQIPGLEAGALNVGLNVWGMFNLYMVR